MPQCYSTRTVDLLSIFWTRKIMHTLTSIL